MVEDLLRAIAGLLNRVRVNRSEFYVEHGVPMVRKRRRAGGTLVIGIANLFLAGTRSGIRMFWRVEEWTAWEAYCSKLLYPDRPAVQIGPPDSVCQVRVEGWSLRQLLERDTLTVKQVATVARELRRVHQIPCLRFQSGWSHGDLHLDNCLIASTAGSPVGLVVLIDFDICHAPEVAETQRHADDVRTVLLELLARLHDPWQPFAKAFLDAYGDPTVLSALGRQLEIPSGFARIWWQTKIYGCPIRVIKPRLAELRELIENWSPASG